MTREMIIRELLNRGYKAEAQNVVKNSVEVEGIRIITETPIAPVIYTEEIIKDAENEGKGIDEVVSAIINIYEGSKSVNIDISSLCDRRFILNNVYIGLQKASTENLVKRDCEELDGIESYLYIRRDSESDETYSVKLTADLLERAEIEETEAWTNAEANTFAETTLTSMAKVICEMTGMEYCEEIEETTPFWVLSNTSKVRGASAILNRKVLKAFAEEHNTDKLVAIPSSVHEFLLVPYSAEMTLETFSNMVAEVNESEVAPIDQLASKAFIITI